MTSNDMGESMLAPKKETPRKSEIARDFGAASKTYNPAARLQRYMGQVMVDRIEAGEADGVALDLGCGTGWFSGQVAERFGGKATIGADLASGMLQFARSANSQSLSWLAADAETLPLADNSVDMIFSNLMIQWAENPVRVLSECKRVLRPGGQLMISTLLDGTLRELKQAWQAVDPGRDHVNRFEPGVRYREQVLQVFPSAIVETETIRLDYPSPMALLSELKAIGAGFKGASRRTSATAPGRLKAMCREYPRSGDGQYYATYEAAWLIGRLSD